MTGAFVTAAPVGSTTVPLRSPEVPTPCPNARLTTNDRHKNLHASKHVAFIPSPLINAVFGGWLGFFPLRGDFSKAGHQLGKFAHSGAIMFDSMCLRW